jgi:large subunit ribosomal protein L21
MFAVAEISGKQYMIEEGTVVRSFSIDAETGSDLVCEKVLVVKGDDGVKVGRPYIDGAKVTFEVLRHDLGKKITVFKFQSKKNHKRTHGHRDHLTYLKCKAIEA